MNLLQTAKKLGNPIIQDGQVTFVWEGKKAPILVSDLHGWETAPQSLTKVKKGLWEISFELAPDAYLEYGFFDPETKKHIPDPLNRKSVSNGMGGHNNYVYMPAAQPSPYLGLPAGGLRGHVTRHKVPSENVTASNSRRIDLYHPPVKEAVPLLVVYDGQDYLRRGGLAEIVDNLIAAKLMRPVGIAFCQNGGKARMVEYGCSEPTLGFLVSQVLPLAAAEMKIIDYKKHPGAHGIMGASMGGLMAVYTALRLPGVFGKALSQAGAFELWEHESIAMQMVRHLPRPEIKLWLDCGAMDFLLDSNRKMSSVLKEQGYNVTYRENGGAHNYTTWRDSCAQGLELLF